MLDGQLCWALRAEAERIKALSPPTRASAAVLQCQFGRRDWLASRLSKLPMTARALAEEAESVEQFRLRRIAWALEELRRRNLPMKTWRLRRVAGLPEQASPPGRSRTESVRGAMIRFKPWEEETEDLELRWLGGFRNDADMGWQVRVISRRLDALSLRYDWVPIGLLSVLTPGRVVSGGEVLSTVVTGVPLKFDIPDLSKGLERDAANVPPELYSFDHNWGWGQRVLRYHVGDEVCLIPTIELVRHLFLLNKRLAWAITDPVGLGNLMVPVMPGIYTDLHIDFTENMPLKCLESWKHRNSPGWLSIPTVGAAGTASVDAACVAPMSRWSRRPSAPTSNFEA
ncbi:MAG: hypothetical protein NVV74_01875 [Magnetospirillum sp.]|nr:hypothetical protein [Magnetospirillum sp.]